ncbi:hypothetical protein PSN45_005110 [Yamadazyma tenuis]|uniref:N-acetyltransferase domain-containing protein n=1 Tax=Candida tenuis (strain ATCC 10573 / BCRC 21748 / CBS 615 / JCM 9827 / NBRC 10315 / NRRL Y-1498 / VKM Y-70) TaxID=590646 RepID=G3B2U4_CANTC|nr:uncharacterized protein CANTEDRAFT_113538 [Yamadazyma tenuis ATCC 10573]EGV64764.1 hypothetical protein CANTEDRAFT_113538 [Yamadazyma tenuis ATCC 10573]WEJ97555.1 hypothetical protein PSN45_005110 [Yamadazyma tenuis]
MSEQFKFRRAETPEKIKQVCELAQEWFLTSMTPENAGSIMLESISMRKDITQVYYLEHTKTNKPVCMVQVSHRGAYYSDSPTASGPSSAPNPDTFGVKPATALMIGFVFTAQAYRKLGLANRLISAVIEYVEKELIKENISKSDKSKPDSFASMVMNNGQLDLNLANYYLGKKYAWVLYSAVGNFYERFGFKAFPVDLFKVPTSVLTDSQQRLLEALMDSSPEAKARGKHLRYLDSSKPQDRDLVSFIMQNKELEILTELNKSTFHSELTGGRKSSSSLTNITDTLAMSKLASQTEMTSISETAGATPVAQRKSSVTVLSSAKFAMKPDVDIYKATNFLSNSRLASTEGFTAENERYNHIEGAIFTNELQQKSYFILWSTLIAQFVVVGVGELQFNMFGPTTDPLGKRSDQRRRGSSFSGLNDLGGYNFQDLDILFSAACSVAKKRALEDKNSIYVAINDLPNTIPAPMLSDYFLHYLPKTHLGADSDKSLAPENQVELYASNKFVLPMLRRFGKESAEFDLDWVANGMLSWG